MISRQPFIQRVMLTGSDTVFELKPGNETCGSKGVTILVTDEHLRQRDTGSALT